MRPLAPVSPVAPAEREQVASHVCPSGCSLCQDSNASGQEAGLRQRTKHTCEAAGSGQSGGACRGRAGVIRVFCVCQDALCVRTARQEVGTVVRQKRKLTCEAAGSSEACKGEQASGYPLFKDSRQV